MKIGTVAKQSGIGIETIRFYEREGLIAVPNRGLSGYREYTEDVIVRLSFIRRAKDLGFSLKEIKELLSLKAKPISKCASVKKKANKKIEEIEEKITQLNAIKIALSDLVESCHSDSPTSDCPILDAFERGVNAKS